MPLQGEKRNNGANQEIYDPTVGWRVYGPATNEPKSSGPSVPTAPAKPKVQSKGTAGLAETQSKSLSQILAERKERAEKAKIIREGGKK